MVLCSLFASLMVLCSWLSIPIPPVGVTLQTFAVLQLIFSYLALSKES